MSKESRIVCADLLIERLLQIRENKTLTLISNDSDRNRRPGRGDGSSARWNFVDTALKEFQSRRSFFSFSNIKSVKEFDEPWARCCIEMHPYCTNKILIWKSRPKSSLLSTLLFYQGTLTIKIRIKFDTPVLTIFLHKPVCWISCPILMFTYFPRYYTLILINVYNLKNFRNTLLWQ